jgi:hypothetical protein
VSHRIPLGPGHRWSKVIARPYGAARPDLLRSDLRKKPRGPRESPRKFLFGSSDKAPACANVVGSFDGWRALTNQVL